MEPADSPTTRATEPAPAPVVIRARNLSKRFGPATALNDVSLEFRAGEVTALLGENGAGKSTLIKCITGVYAPDGGTLEVNGREVHPRSPRDAESLGVSTVYQEINLIPHMTVAENICLGREPCSRFGTIKWGQVRERATHALGRLGVSLDVNRELASCSIAEQQLVAIARALDVSAKALILDEPTSSLDRNEVASLFVVLRRLRQQGLSLIIVTHFLDQVEQIADRVVVLRDGKLVGEAGAREITREQIVSMMVGRTITKHDRSTPDAPPDLAPLLDAKNLSRAGMLDGVDLRIGRGEIVGLVGLLGSGRSETARALFADPPPSKGRITWKGSDVDFRSPRDAISAGIGMTPEDRKADGLLPNLSVHENIAIAHNSKRGAARMSLARSREVAEELVRRLGIKTSGVDAPVSSLSGGNQQKVLLARWLVAAPELLIVDEPTRGIDVGAKADVLAELRSLRERGLSVLLVSSEIEEVVSAASCAVVMRDRRSVARIEGPSMSEARIVAAISESHAT